MFRSTIVILGVLTVMPARGAAGHVQQDSLAKALVEARDCDRAADETTGIAACGRAIQLGLLDGAEPWPASRTFYERLSMAAKARGNRNDVTRIYRRATRVLPSNSQFYFLLGEYLIDQYDAAAEAVGCYMQAVKLDPRSVASRVGLARAQERLGWMEESLASVQAALGIEPENADALITYGQLLLRTDKAHEAVAVFARVARRTPPDSFAVLMWAEALLRDKQPREAVRVLRQLEQSGERAFEVVCGTARALDALGDVTEAKKTCKRALDILPRETQPCECTP